MEAVNRNPSCLPEMLLGFPLDSFVIFSSASLGLLDAAVTGLVFF